MENAGSSELPSSAKLVEPRKPELHKSLSPAAQRALAEAAARRTQSAAIIPKEVGGPEGPEPTRFGDWETKEIAIDF
jgi:hypothetical protein